VICFEIEIHKTPAFFQVQICQVISNPTIRENTKV